MKFSEYLESLNENAGNLKGLPRTFIKEITSYNGNGGKNSKLILDKKKAKRVDLTKLVKKVGGWVDKKYQSYYNLSDKEKEALLMKENYAGVLVKVDGKFKYYITYEEYASKGEHFSVLDENSSWAKGYKATELESLIDFKNSDVELYIVTRDKEREELQKERRIGKDITDNLTKVKEKAVRKYMISKGSLVLEPLQEKLKKAYDNLSKELEKYSEDILAGKSVKLDIVKYLDEFNKIAKQLEELNMYINSGAKDIVQWNVAPREDYFFQKFMKEIAKYVEE